MSTRAPSGPDGAERQRLADDDQRKRNWKRWGPYLSERQWGTVREDYSPDGNSWESFTHEESRSRAYRWGEDGLLGITDRECRLCLAFALWNGKDPILKERLFGLTGPQGNHGEDVKELYWYLDSTPTHSYMRALYKYPQAEFPYARLLDESRKRTRLDREFEIDETGIFDQGRYFDVLAEWAKASPDDILVKLTISNRGPDAAPLHVLPTLWFRNTWSWGRTGEAYGAKPRIARASGMRLLAEHATLGRFELALEEGAGGVMPRMLFTENESNAQRLWGMEGGTPFTKDAFHEHVVRGRSDAVSPSGAGTKAAAWYRFLVPAGGKVGVQLRLAHESEMFPEPFGEEFDRVFARRVAESEAFHVALSPGLGAQERLVTRQAHAGLLWTKQFYHYVVKDWLEGDPVGPPPDESRKTGRNADWRHLYNRDVLSVPDKWEYPWYAAWDLGFHAVAFAKLDPGFAKEQLVLLQREWYTHPNGQLPAYEWGFGDVNPPVHAWACWRVYKMTGAPGARNRVFLARTFHKLMLNFTWWVNRKDVEGRHVFGGGFLGLDNIGVFDRSRPLPTGGTLEQADGTAWMAFYALTMLAMAMELAQHDATYEDLTTKYFEHFIAIADAMNTFGGTGLWDETDGFYYDQLSLDGKRVPLRVRSMVGLVPLLAVLGLQQELVNRLPGFGKRLNWFLENRQDLARQISCMTEHDGGRAGSRLLAIPSRERLVRVLQYLLDEGEFLSDHGVRSLSRVHLDAPYVLRVGGDEWRIRYTPAESDTGLFGGNSNWRGPVWIPMNFLIIEALERFHHFYGDSLQVECPTGSGRRMNLKGVAQEISRRVVRLFLPDATGRRPCHGDDRLCSDDPHFRDLVLFHEYFHGDDGRGLGASHQTGWTALVARLMAG